MTAVTPKHMTLDDLEWPFSVKCCFAPVCLKHGFRSLATLKLVVNAVGELYTEQNSCGIAQFPCDSMAFLFISFDY